MPIRARARDFFLSVYDQLGLFGWLWDGSHTQLKTDNRCRMTSRDLFKPNASYQAEKTPDGAIRLVELDSKPPGKASFVKKNGHILLDLGRSFEMDELEKALENYL